MIQKNLLEQLSTLINIFITNKNVILISVIAVISLILLLLFNHFNNKKIIKIILASIYILIFGTLIYFYHTEIFTFIDYLIDNIFILLFFPNLAIYTLILLIINILMIKSVFSKGSKIIKTISIIFFILFNIIFYLIIDNVIKNNILVYESLSIYTNANLLILIQVSMYIFIIYLVILLISNISNHIINNMKVKEKVTLKNKDIIKQNDKVNLKISDIPDITPNTLVVASEDIKKVKSASIYNEYIDIEPVKKKKVVLTNATDMFKDKELKKDMDVVFGTNTLSNIMNDIEALKGNINNQDQIKKIYESISFNSKDLTLKDYNYLINALKEIKNNN